MLTLTEDRSTIRKLICDYLNENTVQSWKFEAVLVKLLKLELQLEANDAQLLEIGNMYIEEMNRYSEQNVLHLSTEDFTKIKAVNGAISELCTARPIMQRVRENNFASRYISDLKDNAMESSNTKNNDESIQSFTKLTSQQKIIYLAEKFGNNGHLDLITTKFPKRFERHLTQIKRDLMLPLQLMATTEERDILLDISKCENMTNVEDVLATLYARKDLSNSGGYLRFCLAASQALWESNQLLKSSHGEDWYRLHVYSNVFDKAFMNDTEFESKRSECYSNITKLFENEQNQRVDFIFRNLNDESDYISAEEKPGRKGVTKDLRKGKALQGLMLKDWSRRIGSNKLISQFEAITCQWEGTRLLVFATRQLSENTTLVYKKGHFSMPKTVSHMAEFSKLLLAVLSLRRLVLRNYRRLNIILEEKRRNEIEMLSLDEDNDFLLRSDSTVEAELNNDNNSVKEDMDAGLEQTLLKAIKKVTVEESVKTYSDWEEFLMEKIKRRKVSLTSAKA